MFRQSYFLRLVAAHRHFSSSCASMAKQSTAATNNVSIFWDYENTPIPSKSSADHVVSAIRAVAQSHGKIQTFKAYLEFSTSSGILSQLRAAGVTLVDCPHSGMRNVCDFKLTTDVCSYMKKRPLPETVVLISGDADLAYIASHLRFGKYKVVLVAPSWAKKILRDQANELVDWKTVWNGDQKAV